MNLIKPRLRLSLSLPSLLVSLTIVAIGLPHNADGAQPATIVKIPAIASATCEETINSTKEELKNKGFFVPWRNPRTGITQPKVNIDPNLIDNNYYNYPPERPETVNFILGNVDNLYSSPRYMVKLSAKIMAQCEKVGMVRFTYWWEGWAEVGYFPDGTARTFINIYDNSLERLEAFSRLFETPAGKRRKFQWGYYFTP
ncbi:MAG: hypothetical protein WCO45_14725 [Pseudanabaena sp. ELA607]